MNSLIHKFSTKKATIGASILRIGFGILILYLYAINYSYRHLLWGYNSLANTEYSQLFKSFSLYQFGNSNLFFEIIFHLGILIAIMFTLGYKTRIVSVLNFIFLFSIHQENPTILDGGDNIMIIVLIYLIFVKTNAYFSVDKYLSQGKVKRYSDNFYVNIIHNFGVLAIILQLCILYLNSSLYKVMGEVWQNGTAIYYILQVKEFNLPWVTTIVNSSDFLIVFITYFTILMQLAFPFMLLNRVTKYIALACVVPMHLGIAFVMGLIPFSLTMIIIDAILISNNDYRRVYHYFNAKFQKEKIAPSAIPQSDLIPKTTNIVVLYDGWCPLCQKVKSRIEKIDISNKVYFLSFRDQGVLQGIGISPNEAEKEMIAIDIQKNNLYSGVHSFYQISQKTPLLWFLSPFLFIGIIVGLGDKIYNFIASRRSIVPINQCSVDDCEIQLDKNRG
ncbi:DCC1-like thiol-disulfide oxidoreductase family protein [Ornithinibacillus halophilus]|uniref:Predicted thiol-disulfide oxidoreductase YuxK, DCC family n=1 Tax=Ornithinibacillus halophilus TaxID=930117 RepID=A0A1M5FW20_9BACI|nr:DCC1-like thiol-disulfide oxidoreductase family protein [Ornithinibacillus halophilus]SHF95656.1 Predicted thiol-disulfide oxidoreductase YuxK, DCC family [Ornithinibacillus halophilus]